MFEKGKRERRNSEEDAVFNRMLIWLGGAVAVELLLFVLRGVYVNMWLGSGAAYVLLTFFQLFSIAGAVLTAAGAVWSVVGFRGKKPVALPLAVTCGVAVLWIVSVLSYLLFDEGVKIAMMLPAAAAVLILIFFLYQRPFFYNALLTGGGLLALWLHRQYYMNHPTAIRVCFAAGIVVLAAAAALAFRLSRNDGKLGKLQVMPTASNYVMTWATCGVTALAMVLALVLAAPAAQYLLYVLVGWLFAQAVFFTVKMM